MSDKKSGGFGLVLFFKKMEHLFLTSTVPIKQCSPSNGCLSVSKPVMEELFLRGEENCKNNKLATS